MLPLINFGLGLLQDVLGGIDCLQFIIFLMINVVLGLFLKKILAYGLVHFLVLLNNLDLQLSKRCLL